LRRGERDRFQIPVAGKEPRTEGILSCSDVFNDEGAVLVRNGVPRNDRTTMTDPSAVPFGFGVMSPSSH
jgi:hypothetical protein